MGKNIEEKKSNKKLLIIGGIILAIVIVMVIVAVIWFACRPSYRTQIEKFIEACESEEKMDEFVDKYIDLRAFYTMQNLDDATEFKKDYKEAKKDDYKNVDFVKDVKELYHAFTSTDKIEIVEIGDLKLPKDISDTYKQYYGQIDGMKIAKCKFKLTQDDETEEIEMDAIFYKDRLTLMTANLEEMITSMNEINE